MGVSLDIRHSQFGELYLTIPPAEVDDQLWNIHRLVGKLVELRAIAGKDWLLSLPMEAGIQEGAYKTGYRLSGQLRAQYGSWSELPGGG